MATKIKSLSSGITNYSGSNLTNTNTKSSYDKNTTDYKSTVGTYTGDRLGNVNMQKYNYDNIYNALAKDYGVGSYGSNGGYRPDTSSAIAAINSMADANRNTVANTYNTKRTDLLDSLKRYQDSNIKQATNQKQTYLTSRSALDTAKDMADRQARISNSARGLGGSGLQQLAELQNDLGTQSEESLLANSNQRELDNLKTLLTNYTEDTDKAINNAYNDYQNSLRTIDADTARQIADVNYQANAIAAQNAAQSSALNNQAAASAKQTATALYNALNSTINSENSATSLAGIFNNMSQSELAKEYGLNKNASKAEIGNKILSDYTSRLDSLNNAYGMDTDTYNKARQNIMYSLKYYGYI